MTSKLHHIALEYSKIEDARIFFKEILGLEEVKSFTLSAELSHNIFSLNHDVDVVVFADDQLYVEVFLTSRQKPSSYEHICLIVENTKELFHRCHHQKLTILQVAKGEKNLMFIRDPAGYLYEIKQRQ